MATPIATEYSTDTILGMINQYQAMMGNNIPYEYLPDTTLNSKYGVCVPVRTNNVWSNVPPAGRAPAIAYFGVGIRGFYNITSDDDISPLSQPYAPMATEMDLYRPIPIRCVPIEEDLDATAISAYRMRTVITVNGNAYACYWLKKIEFETSLNVNTVSSNGSVSAFDFTNLSDNLNPTPIAPTTPTISAGSSKVVVSANIKCVLSGSEILEAINVLYHGDLRRARISEWGIYTGVDGTNTRSYIDSNGNSAEGTYTEALYVQLAAKRCTTGVDLSNSSSEQHEVLTIQNGNLLLID